MILAKKRTLNEENEEKNIKIKYSQKRLFKLFFWLFAFSFQFFLVKVSTIKKFLPAKNRK
jgi:hypothetical protein